MVHEKDIVIQVIVIDNVMLVKSLMILQWIIKIKKMLLFIIILFSTRTAEYLEYSRIFYQRVVDEMVFRLDFC